MVAILLHQPRYEIDKYFENNVALARIHLGLFNPEVQPSISADGKVATMIDGKIFNYIGAQDSSKQAGKEGMNDAEFCLSRYRENGLNFINELNGNFFIALHDKEQNKVIFANDRYGFRTHYFSYFKGNLLIAPEQKAILEFPGFKKELDEGGLAEFFAYGEFWGGKTLFKNISSIPPGSILVFENGDLSMRRYWKPTFKPDRNKKEGEFVDALVTSYRQAVARRLEDNLRHGITLSGGLDSRSVIGAMPKEHRSKSIAFTFGDEESQEVRVAAMVVKESGILKHVILGASPELIIKNAERDAWLTDGALYIGLAFVYPLFEKISKDVDVIFDGYALDLTLGGSYLSKDKIGAKNRDELKAILLKKRRFNDEKMKQLLNRDLYERIKHVPDESFEREFTACTSEDMGNLSDEFAMNTHVAWMHVGDIAVRSQIEVAHPTSDNEFFDLLLTIPPELRFDHRLYRKWLKSLSPELARIPYNHTMVRADAPIFLWHLGVKWNRVKEFAKKRIQIATNNRILPRSKRSYVSYNEWLRTRKDWQDFFEGVLNSYPGLIERYLNREYITKAFEEHKRGVQDHSMDLLYIATFILFLAAHFENEAS